MKGVVDGTPLEPYEVDGRAVWVKREDLSCPEPGPGFSKIRGVEKRLQKRPETTIGTLDTFHSKAGWGVSFLCRELGKRSVVFYPEYKADTGLRHPQRMAVDLGAVLVPLPAGRSAILYHQAKKRLRTEFPDSYMMPNALKLPESVDGTAREVFTVPPEFFEDTTWIVSISSGTIAAGVLKGLIWKGAKRCRVWLHLGYSRSKSQVERYVTESAGGVISRGLELLYVDEGYAYKDHVRHFCPFPCNPYYDLKAWKWMSENLESFGTERILFWNIGK